MNGIEQVLHCSEHHCSGFLILSASDCLSSAAVWYSHVDIGGVSSDHVVVAAAPTPAGDVTKKELENKESVPAKGMCSGVCVVQ